MFLQTYVDHGAGPAGAILSSRARSHARSNRRRVAARPPWMDVRVQLRWVIMRVGVLRIAERWSRPRGGGRTGRLLAWPALLVALSVSALAEPLPRSALMLNQSDADSPWYRIFSSS